MQKINRFYQFDIINFTISLLFCIIILLGNFISPNFNNKLSLSIKTPMYAIKYYFSEGIVLQYQAFIANKKIIESLQQENNTLREELSLNAIHSFKNTALNKNIDELTNLLKLNNASNIDIMGTFPISLSTSNFLYQNLIIKLKNDDVNNIETNKLVVSTNMVIGYVSKIYNNYAEVLTILDTNFRISAFSEKSKINLIISGNGTYYPDVTLYSENNNLQEGEIIYTSGLEGNFPRYIPIGILIKNDNKWKVKINSNVFDIHYVLVLK